MNTRSFADRNKKSSITHSAGIAPQFRASQVRAAQIQKRWQPKQLRQRLNSKLTPTNTPEPTATPGDRSVSSPFDLAEQTMLLRQQALACAHQGDYAKAIHLFSQLLEQNPCSAIDYSNRGLVYFQTRQVEQALADYDKAIALNPRLDSAYNNRANYYAAQGQYLEAILDYDIALDLNPANVRAWINQGITFRELEMYDRALESFDFALCLDRLEGHIYAERGRTYHLRGDWNCAIANYQRASVKLPQVAKSASDAVVRLRLQVEGWMDELLDAVVEKDPNWKLH